MPGIILKCVRVYVVLRMYRYMYANLPGVINREIFKVTKSDELCNSNWAVDRGSPNKSWSFIAKISSPTKRAPVCSASPPCISPDTVIEVLGSSDPAIVIPIGPPYLCNSTVHVTFL